MTIRRTPISRACYFNKGEIEDGLLSLSKVLEQSGVGMDTWFTIGNVTEKGYSIAMESATTTLGRGRGTVQGTPDNVKLKGGIRHNHAISVRLNATFGSNNKIIGHNMSIERREHTPKHYQFRLCNNLSLKELIKGDPVTSISKASKNPFNYNGQTTFQRKLGGYAPDKVSGKEPRDWLKSEIMAAVDIYVDELMEENRKLREQLETIKNLPFLR
jgi:hypothetical protein